MTTQKEKGRDASPTRPKENQKRTTPSIYDHHPYSVMVWERPPWKDAGVVHGRRRLVNWWKAFLDYLSCNEESGTAYRGDGEAYLSIWAYGEGFLDHYSKRKSDAEYRGKIYSHCLHMDFDATAEDAIRSAQKVLKKLEDLGVNLEETIACFSGNRGAHLYIPLPSVVVPSVDFVKQCSFVARALSEGCTVPCDPEIYKHAQLFRLPNTRHPKTGKFKVPYLGSEFVKLHPAEIAKGEAPRAINEY